MFFSRLSDLPRLVRAANFSVIVADPDSALSILEKNLKTSLSVLSPEEKTGKISVDAVRDFISSTSLQEKSDRFYCIKSAETLNPASENAILKTLEEPRNNHFFIFLTASPSALLPTILSRAHVYILKSTPSFSAPPAVEEKIKTDAKSLISALTLADKNPKPLIDLATTLSKKKDNARLYSESVVSAAIEMLYKTYFLTEKDTYLKLLPGLITLHNNLSKNGHIKLQIVASML